MSDQRLLKNKDKIKKIIELACKFKLNAKLVFGEIEQYTYLLNVSESGRLAVVHRQNEAIDSALTSGQSVTLRFDYVERGYLHIFAFEIVAPENDSYKYYDAIWMKMPESMQELTVPEPYLFVSDEEKPIMLNFSLKDQNFKEEIVRISVDGVQFFARSKKLDSKTLWAGRKLESVKIDLPAEHVHLEMQLSKREGSGWLTRFNSPDRDELKIIQEYVTRKFFESAKKEKLEYLVDPVEALSTKVRTGPNRKVIIYERDEDTNLALKELLESRNYKVMCALAPEEALRMSRAEKPGLLLLDVSSPKSSGMAICRELKGNFYTKNVPILFMSQHFKRTDLPVISQYGAREITEKPLYLPDVIYRVDLILDPDNAKKPPRRSAMAAHPEGKSASDVSAPNFEKVAAQIAKSPTILLANQGDIFTPPRVRQWANEHGFELITVEEIQSFEQETQRCKPVLAIVNLQDTNQKTIVEKCQMIRSDIRLAELPLFITDASMSPNSVRRADKSTFFIQAISEKFLSKLDALVTKISRK
ncbi:MAG: response regulator [Calditrichaeota bacterium]|nr:response regulator [Calditrichota bacterium]MCB0300721.1 response regulator [Calditrichota bacterium]